MIRKRQIWELMPFGPRDLPISGKIPQKGCQTKTSRPFALREFSFSPSFPFWFFPLCELLERYKIIITLAQHKQIDLKNKIL